MVYCTGLENQRAVKRSKGSNPLASSDGTLADLVYAQDWKCLLITYDEEGTEEGIPVEPVWKWLMEV